MRLLGVLGILVLAACSATATPTLVPVGSCTIPLRTKADVEACHSSAQYVSDEDVSIPGQIRVNWNYVLKSEDPAVIVQALGALAEQQVGGGDEIFIFLFGSNDFSGGYNRGRVVLTHNGGNYKGDFDVCTTITTLSDSAGSFQQCVEQTHFSAPLN